MRTFGGKLTSGVAGTGIRATTSVRRPDKAGCSAGRPFQVCPPAVAPGAGAQPSLPPPRQALLSAQGVAGVSRSERLGQTDASLRRDGPDQGSPQLGVFSGNTALETAYSSGNRVLLQFHSDFSNGGFFVLNFHGERTSAPRARAGGGGSPGRASRR